MPSRSLQYLKELYATVPRRAVSPSELLLHDLDHRAGFLLDRIDGRTSLEDLLALSPMPSEETANILVECLERGLIG